MVRTSTTLLLIPGRVSWLKLSLLRLALAFFILQVYYETLVKMEILHINWLARFLKHQQYHRYHRLARGFLGRGTTSGLLRLGDPGFWLWCGSWRQGPFGPFWMQLATAANWWHQRISEKERTEGWYSANKKPPLDRGLETQPTLFISFLNGLGMSNSFFWPRHLQNFNMAQMQTLRNESSRKMQNLTCYVYQACQFAAMHRSLNYIWHRGGLWSTSWEFLTAVSGILPVVPHKAVAEVSRRGKL